jgi:hypothetical protein
VDLWVDTKINAGQKWRAEIEGALDRAAVAVLLVSADFLASDFVVENELPPLLKAAQLEGVTILPLILKPCAFSATKEISQFQAINAPSSPLISLDETQREAIWVKVAEAVSNAVEVLSQVAVDYEGVETPMFDQFGWATELVRSEIRNPDVIEEYEVYQYQHIDCLELMPFAEAVLQKVPNRNDVLQAVRNRFLSSGWEGDGDPKSCGFPLL